MTLNRIEVRQPFLLKFLGVDLWLIDVGHVYEVEYQELTRLLAVPGPDDPRYGYPRIEHAERLINHLAVVFDQGPQLPPLSSGFTV